MMTGYASISPSFRTPEWRAVRAGLFVAMGLSAIVPVIHGIFAFGIEHLDRHIRLKWLVTQGALYIVGAGLYAARVPERIWPGHFDLFLASHQIFHFLVVAAVITHLCGLVKAFHSKHTSAHASIKVTDRPKRD
jgi:adiponectin receptor